MNTQTLDLSPRKLALIMVGTILVLAVATWFMLVAPKRSSATDLQASIQDAQTQLTVREHAKSTRSNAKQEAANELRLTRAMPNVLAMPQVVLQLSRLATEEHVSLDAITPQAPAVYSGYDEVPMNVVVSGEFFAVEGFLRELRMQVQTTPDVIHATGRLFDVQTVTLQQNDTTPGVTATLTIGAFYYTGVPLAPPVTSTTADSTAGGT